MSTHPCAVCSKPVYRAERKYSHRGQKWHFNCFRCSAANCDRRLQMSTVLFDDGKPYCPRCHSQTLHKKSATLVKKIDFSGEEAEQIETWSPSHPQKNSLVASLPPELLLKVLKYLAQPDYINPGGWKAFLNLSEACKYLYSISWDPALPRVLTLPNITRGGLQTQIPGIGTTTPVQSVSFPIKIEKDPSFPKFRDLFTKTATHIRINVWKDPKFNDIISPTLKAIGSQPRVTSFDFTGPTITLREVHFDQLVKNFPNMIKADFRGCHGVRKHLVNISKYPKTLEYLNVSSKSSAYAQQIYFNYVIGANWLSSLKVLIVNYQVILNTKTLSLPNLRIFCNLHTTNLSRSLSPSLDLTHMLKRSPLLTELSFPHGQFLSNHFQSVLINGLSLLKSGQPSILDNLQILQCSRTWKSDFSCEFTLSDSAATILLSASNLRYLDIPVTQSALSILIPHHTHFCSQVSFLNLIYVNLDLDLWNTIDFACPNLRTVISSTHRKTPISSGNPESGITTLWGPKGVLCSSSFCEKVQLSFLCQYFIEPITTLSMYDFGLFVYKQRNVSHLPNSSFSIPHLGNIPGSAHHNIRAAISGVSYKGFPQIVDKYTTYLEKVLRFIKKCMIFVLYGDTISDLKEFRMKTHHQNAKDSIKRLLEHQLPLLYVLGYSHAVLDALYIPHVSKFLDSEKLNQIKSTPLTTTNSQCIIPDMTHEIDSVKHYFPRIYSDTDPFLDLRPTVPSQTDSIIGSGTNGKQEQENNIYNTSTVSASDGEDIVIPSINTPSVSTFDDEFSLEPESPSPQPSPRTSPLETIDS